MAAANRSFYSMKFNRPDSIASHLTRQAAIKRAGDFGVVFDVDRNKQLHIHLMSNNRLKAFSEGSTEFSAMDDTMKNYLVKANLIKE